jgi:hypothetical protein
MLLMSRHAAIANLRGTGRERELCAFRLSTRRTQEANWLSRTAPVFLKDAWKPK